MTIAGERTQRNVKKSSTPVPTPSPSAIMSSPRRWGPSDFYERHWIPAFAGMTGWPTGPARHPVSMRLVGHALPRRGGLPGGLGPGPGPTKREAAPSDAKKKCRVDQAWHKCKGCQRLGGWPTGWPRARATSGHQQRIHQTPCHPERSEGSAFRNLARPYWVDPALR